MPRGALRALAPLGALVLVVACKGPTVPHPLANQFRYTCCNIHYEKDTISDVNYLVGTMIPYGTRVQILEVRKNSVKFQATGQPPLTLVLKYGKNLSMDQYLDRIFLAADPHAKLRADVPPARLKKVPDRTKRPVDQVPDKTKKLIDEGTVDVGMTRDQVLMSLGYPPAHRTPSLDAPAWTYWQNRWVTMQVYFDGDKVSRVQR